MTSQNRESGDDGVETYASLAHEVEAELVNRLGWAWGVMGSNESKHLALDLNN